MCDEEWQEIRKIANFAIIIKKELEMCVERAQRLIMAIMLGMIMGLAASGWIAAAFILQLIMMIMLIVWALTNFCPSIFLLKKILPPCKWD